MINNQYFNTIRRECSRFIEESKGLPLLKNLPSRYNDVQCVKVRHRKMIDERTQLFNDAFAHKLRQRAVFAHGASSFKPILDETVRQHDIFYVIPTDQYKFIYNEAVIDSTNIANDLHNDTLVTDVLRFGYTSLNLYEGIVSGAEIILYDIPRYYCVRSSAIEYNDLLTLVS